MVSELRIRINLGKIVSIFFNLIAAIVIVIRRFLFLIIFPYKTMRKICQEKDWYQIAVIFFIVFAYFKFIYYLRDNPYPATLLFAVFLLNLFGTSGFFYLLGHNFRKGDFPSIFFTLSYSLFPTLLWFITSSILYLVFPPPRTLSLLGKGFSVIFIAFSISLLVWKLILVYLALRFSTRSNFFRILYFFCLYLIWFIPYSIFLYHLKIFRIPFI